MPTFAEYDTKLKAMKALALLKPSLRPQVAALERSLRALIDSVDGFYRVLARRDWVYHDQLSVEKMQPAIDAEDADALERYLVDFYGDAHNLTRLRAQLSVMPNMPERIHLVDFARDDHLAGRYYATTLTLLAVMDGFANEIEKARRGLSSRDAEEINPWDSAVGHHGGLKAAHRSFTRTFKATSTDEIFTLHRNGIVHGNLPNFNNAVVASKAWNRLMAVKDWARALEAASAPAEPPPPSIRESLGRIAAIARRTDLLKKWTHRTVTLERDGSEVLGAEPVAIAATSLFDAWMTANYGRMAPLLRDAPKRSGLARFAGEVRKRFEGAKLTAFRIDEVRMLTASMAVTVATLTVDGITFVNETHWNREDDDRRSVPEFEDGGTWRSIHYYPDEYGERLET